jgi:hypothetical protein
MTHEDIIERCEAIGITSKVKRVSKSVADMGDNTLKGIALNPNNSIDKCEAATAELERRDSEGVLD